MNRKLIAEIIEKLFPGGAVFCSNTKDIAPDCRFWIIPGSQGPRWIVPADPRHGWPFLKQWQPYKVGSRLKWRALIAAYRGNQLGRVPGIKFLGVTGFEDRTWDHVGWSGRKPPAPVIYIGTPGPARKPVVGLIDTDESCVATIGKIPLGPQALRAISHETEILTRLEKEKPSVAPCSLFVDKKTGIAVQEFIAGKPTGRRLTEAHISWLFNLENPGETMSLREETERMAQQIAGFKDIDQGTRNVLNGLLSEIDDPFLMRPAWVHGDFAPWNLKREPGQTIRAIDWESACPRGLPVFDLVYYQSIQIFLFKEKKLFPGSMQPLLRQYMDHFGIGLSMFRKIVFACLIQDWLRCYEEGDLRRASSLLQQLSVVRANME